MPTRQPRGLRNHNPGNIRRNANVVWRGQADAAAQTDPEFVVFAAPEWGLRAICRILLTYEAKGVCTPAAIAHRWAPPLGQRPDGSRYTQDSDAYGRHLAKAVGAELGTVLDLRDPAIMGALLVAIVRHENGQQPYGFAMIRRALELAGLSVEALSPERIPTTTP